MFFFEGGHHRVHAHVMCVHAMTCHVCIFKGVLPSPCNQHGILGAPRAPPVPMPLYMCMCVHSSCSAQTGQHEACICECCPRPVGALQLICWKLLSKRHDIV